MASKKCVGGANPMCYPMAGVKEPQDSPTWCLHGVKSSVARGEVKKNFPLRGARRENRKRCEITTVPKGHHVFVKGTPLGTPHKSPLKDLTFFHGFWDYVTKATIWGKHKGIQGLCHQQFAPTTYTWGNLLAWVLLHSLGIP